MDKETVKTLVGERVLLRHEYGSSTVFEATVLEVSPSFKYTLVMFQNKGKSWIETDDLHLVEILPRGRKDDKSSI